MRGDVLCALASYAELDRLGRELGDPVARYHAAYGDVLRTTLRRDYTAAIAAAGRVRDAGLRALPDQSGPALGYFGTLGILQLLQGTVPEGLAPIATTFPQPTMDASFRAYFAVVSAQRGNLPESRAAIEHLDAAALAALPRDLYWPSVVWLLAEAFAALADRERAEALYALAEPFADVVIVDGACDFLGAMSHHLGVLATTMGADAVAAELFEHAAALHSRLGATEWAEASRRGSSGR
jgi:hypothetical protein